jgi:hypothetical protein
MKKHPQTGRDALLQAEEALGGTSSPHIEDLMEARVSRRADVLPGRSPGVRPLRLRSRRPRPVGSPPPVNPARRP